MNAAPTITNVAATTTRSSHENYCGDKKSTLSYRPGVVNTTSESQSSYAYWPTDQSYSDYIKQAKDCCIPDRNMVQLWCRRNELHFVEVSVLDGTGVDYVVESTVMGILDGRQQQHVQYICNDGHSGMVDIDEE